MTSAAGADSDPLADVVARLASVVAAPDDQLLLDEAALCVAAADRPDLDIEANLERLDELAGQVAEPTLDGVRGLLFGSMGFTGDAGDYYDVANSQLDVVLDRRRGLPITLSVLLIEVARRVGVPLLGIGMPGHFLVRAADDADRFVDPFAGGAVLDRRGCRVRFRAVHGPAAPFLESYLEPTRRVAIIARMLANLEHLAATRADHDLLVGLLRLRSTLPTSGPEDRAALDATRSVLDRRN